MFVYGYCRISTPQQNIERQVRNIAAAIRQDRGITFFFIMIFSFVFVLLTPTL